MIDIDFETRSRIDITETGAWKYSEDPSTEVLCMAYKLPGKPTALWLPKSPPPPFVLDQSLIKKYGGIRAHNASFEQAIWKNVMVPKYGAVDVPIELWHDTMAQCAASSLPMSLGEAGKVLRLDVQKDEEGRRVMLQLSQPRRPSASNPKEWYEFEDAKDKFLTLYKYCINDVDTQTELGDRLPQLSSEENMVWFLDQNINQRGIFIDANLAHKCQDLLETHLKKYNEFVKSVTGVSVFQVTELRRWVEENGVPTPSLAKANIEALLALPTLPPKVREILDIRNKIGKSSVKKIAAMLSCMSSGDRVRYTALYHGASTGRFAGRLIQPQNFARGLIDKDKHGFDMDEAITLLQKSSYEEIISICDTAGLDFMDLVSSCLRGFISAPEGKDLVQADYSNIEGRILAWVAGEDWKVEAFSDFDKGIGPDLYKASYSRAFNVPLAEVTKAQRQIGKIMELALGYAGGVGAFRSMAKGYGVRLRPLYELIWSMASEKERKSAQFMLKQTIDRNKAAKDMPYDPEEFTDMKDFEEEFLACEITKIKWRSAHPRVVAFWKELEEAAIHAISQPDTYFAAGNVSYIYERKAKCLFCALPSGRRITYVSPSLVRDVTTAWNGEKITKYSLAYMGTNSVTKKWEQQRSYGGHLCENICQAIARDCLIAGMFSAENNGYEIVMTVHDEIVAEVKDTFGSVEDFEEIICRMPDWAKGLPLAAEGWRAKRYRK